MSVVRKASEPAPTLNPALREFWETPARNRVLYGGRSSSKSWDASGFAIFLACNYQLRFLCVRQFQNKISESVYTLLKIQIERFGLEHEFQITQTSIRHRITGSEFLFYGIWRHISEIKSTEGIDVLWIEEAHDFTAEQWKILEPTVRSEGSQVWIIFNPRFASDFVYRRFVTNPPPNTIKRFINYDENPFLSKTMLDIIEAKRVEDEEEFAHIYLGQPLENDDQVIIKRAHILAAIDAHKKIEFPEFGKVRIGFDIADGGPDKNAMVCCENRIVDHVEEWKGQEDELLKSANRVFKVAVSRNAEIDYDSIGVGAFAGAHFNSLNEKRGLNIVYRKFNASGKVLYPARPMDPNDPNSPKNRDYFHNYKAQAWTEVARFFRATYNAVEKGHDYKPEDIISISSECDHLDRLVDELATVRKDTSELGKMKAESKKDLKKRDVPSPNLADGFIAATATPKQRKSVNWYVGG